METSNFLSQFSIVSAVKSKADKKRLSGVLKLLAPHFHATLFRITCNPLTKREAETLALLAEGFSDKEVSALLSPLVTVEAVHKINQRVKTKLKTRSSKQMIYIASKLGMI